MAWARFRRSFRYALRGLATALREQPNARIHLAAAVAAVATGWLLPLSRLEWCFIASAVALGWVAELLNTALEYAVDLAADGARHALAAKVKDVAAGAVLVAAAYAAFTGAMVFGPHLWVLSSNALRGG